MSATDASVIARARIPRDLDRALERYVELTRLSKTSVIAIALAEYLEAAGALPPGTASAIKPVSTQGPRRPITEEKESHV